MNKDVRTLLLAQFIVVAVGLTLAFLSDGIGALIHRWWR